MPPNRPHNNRGSQPQHPGGGRAPLHFPPPPPQHIGPAPAPAPAPTRPPAAAAAAATGAASNMPKPVPMVFPPAPPTAAISARPAPPQPPSRAIPRPPPPPPGASYAPGYAPPSALSSSSSASTTNPLALGFYPEDVAKMCKLFIGNISSGVTDEWLERLLVACGPIKEWKRMRGPDGALKAFGFVTYSEPMGTVRALECLGEVAGKEAVVVPSLDGGEHKRVLLKLDDDAKKMLDRFKAARGTQPLDLEHDRMARRRIHESLDLLRAHAGLPPLAPNAMYPGAASSSHSTTASASAALDTHASAAAAATGADDTSSSLSSSTLPRESTPGVLDLDAFAPKSVAAPAKLAKPKPVASAEPGPAAPRRRRWDQDSTPTAPVVVPAAMKPQATPTMQAAGFVALTSRAAPSAGVWAAPRPTGEAAKKVGGGLTLGKPLALGAGGKAIKFGFGGRASPSPASGMGDGEAHDEEDAGKKKSRLVLLAEQHRLAASEGVSVASMSDHTVLGYSVPWDKVSREALGAEIAPRVAQLVSEFLGEDDDDLAGYFVQEIAHCGSAREVVVELEGVFGKDEANSLVAGVWREVLRVALSG